MKNLHSIKLSIMALGLFSLCFSPVGYAALSAYQEDLNVAAYAAALNDHDFALSKYRQITEKYPQEAGSWSSLGEYLFKQGKLEEAAAAFGKAVTIDANYPAAQLRLGEIAYRKQDYSVALAYLEKEKTEKADAYYWMGRIYEAQNNALTAEKFYKKAGRKNSGYADAADISQYLVSVQNGESAYLPAAAESGRPWDLRLGSGFVYTDNVAGSHDKTLRPADMDQRWDYGWNYDVAASYKAVDTEHFDLSARYDLDHLIYFEAEDFNQLTNRVQLDPEMHFGNWTLGSNLFWEHQTLGGDAYRHVWGARPWVGYLWERFQFVTGYEWNDGKYHYTPANGKQNRDNEIHKMDHSVIYYPSRYLSHVTAGISYGMERAKGSDYNQNFIDTYLALNTREWHQFSFNSAVYTGWQDYLQPNTGALVTESQRRRGQDFGFHTEIVRRFGDSGFRVYARYQYDRRASNITFYSSTTNTISTGVKYDF